MRRSARRSTGLTPGTTYHFRVVADNGTGGVQQGADQVFSTAPGDAAERAPSVTASSRHVGRHGQRARQPDHLPL